MPISLVLIEHARRISQSEDVSPTRTKMDEHLRILEEEYCPPLDSALVFAIFSDFAGQPNALALVKEILDPFRESAIAEQLTDFDASGSSGGLVQDGPNKRNGEDVDSNADTWATQTTLTDQSQISSHPSNVSVGGNSGASSEELNEGSYWKDAENFDQRKKELILAETFPSLRPELIAYTLKKSGNDLEKATDELLNHAYFESSRGSPTEEGSFAKGIDAFSEEFHVPQKSKKGKNRKQQKKSAHYTSLPSSPGLGMSTTPHDNRWLNTSRDVDFIVNHTNLPHKMVSSLYHANGTSLLSTVLAIVGKDVEAHKQDEPDASLVQDAISLNEHFPMLDLETTSAIMRLTNSSSEKAGELAKVVIEKPTGALVGQGGIKLDLRYAPVDLSDPDEQHAKLPTLAPSARPHDTVSLANARGDAFQQASAAYRRGKSTPLMRQAAAYYAQEGRDISANLKVRSQAEADAFVMSQSGSTYLDLHGVTVANATRIAKQRTQMWWDSLGERKISEWGNARGGVGDGYRIVTGLGRHSEGGRGKIGPAVMKSLMSEGWKVEVGTGELIVTGHAKRR